MQRKENYRNKQIDLLRGIAALMVCFFHLTGSAGLSKETGEVGRLGYLGVEIFFVISGFVIPYSMYLSRYSAKKFIAFITKRIFRINPPYLVTIIVTILLIAVTGRESVPSVQSVLLHSVYLNKFFGFDNLSPVFWTLSIEFQYYLFMGLSFMLISSPSQRLFFFCLQVLLICSWFSTSEHWLLWWLGFFIIGVLIFRFKHCDMPAHWFAFTTGEALFFIFFKNGLPETLAATFTLLVILLAQVKKEGRVLKAFLYIGTISYSLYLIHWEFGRSIVAVSRHIPMLGTYEFFRVGMGMAGSVIGAAVFYLIIERPSIQLSKVVKDA